MLASWRPWLRPQHGSNSGGGNQNAIHVENTGTDSHSPVMPSTPYIRYFGFPGVKAKGPPTGAGPRHWCRPQAIAQHETNPAAERIPAARCAAVYGVFRRRKKQRSVMCLESMRVSLSLSLSFSLSHRRFLLELNWSDRRSVCWLSDVRTSGPDTPSS